jgi:hypothetical protein
MAESQALGTFSDAFASAMSQGATNVDVDVVAQSVVLETPPNDPANNGDGDARTNVTVVAGAVAGIAVAVSAAVAFIVHRKKNGQLATRRSGGTDATTTGRKGASAFSSENPLHSSGPVGEGGGIELPVF